MVPFWNRIKFKLLFFGIIMSIVPIAVAGSYTIRQTQTGLEESIQEKQLYIVQRAATEVEHLLTAIKGRMQLIVDANDVTKVHQNHQQWEKSLYGFLKQNPEIENAFLFNENGQIMGSALRFDVSPPQQIKEEQLLKIRGLTQKNQCLVGDVIFKEDGNPYVNLALPFYSPDQSRFYGGMLIEVSLKGTFKQISSINAGQSGYIYLIDNSSRLIAHTDFGQVLLGTDVITSPELQQLVQQKDVIQKPITYQSYTGKKVIGAYASISSAKWGVVIEQPINKAFASIQTLTKGLIFSMIIVAAMVVLISIFFGIWFTKPIELMEKAVRRVTKGELNAKIDYQSKDEFGKLAHAFNHMTEELRIKNEHLAQEKERLNTIINGSRAGFALVHEDYTVEWMNDRLREWLAEEQNDLSCYSLLGRLKEPCKDCPITLKDPMQCQNEVITTVNNQGIKRMYSHRMFPLEQFQIGEPNYLIMVEDITEQRQLEEMVIQADKLSALGILASGFAHEVNNPLAAISAYAEDLKERVKEESPEELLSNGEMDHYLDTIRNNVDRCKTITNNLLNFSRKESLVSNDVLISKIIDDSLSLLKHQLKKKQIQLEKQIPVELSSLKIDGLQLQQVLVNLIQNAVDAMEEMGKLGISANENTSSIEIKITDNGMGMTEMQMAKAFDPFYTTKPVGKGTGLGLYISYNIIKKMNGNIVIDSEQGLGTTMTIILPK